jgi:uncharacterized protein (DUF362 family)/Pyruvate/2-oxoacid:ferredoxin oxidoreductase delta subunit
MSKVSLVRCCDYKTDNVFAAVKRAVDLVGGMGHYVKPGMKVLLKPNLLSARLPEEAVDTHPEVVRAVGRLAKSCGAVVSIGDSPGGFDKNIDEIFERSGMKAVASEEGFELARFTTSAFIHGIPISRKVLDCDCMISIPKLKTHSITVMTAAIKNTYGAVTGLYKAECHSKAPREEDFVKIIARVYAIVTPQLNIVDGIVGMEGDGPAAGDPKGLNVILAGEDGVAIDACVARIMGLQPLDVLVTKTAYEMGLGEADLARIEILGDDINSFIARDFRMPQTTPLKVIPRAVVNALASFIRFKPYIDSGICNRCNLCKVTCPVNAIDTEEGHCEIDYHRCIRCLCCHEVCPYGAISIKRNMLTKLVWG